MSAGFERLAAALAREAARLARARNIERRAGDAKWRSPRVLWPRFAGED